MANREMGFAAHVRIRGQIADVTQNLISADASDGGFDLV
jgi:hypothetical protein